MRLFAVLTLSAAALAGCTTTPLNAPVEVLRYHLGPQLARGTVVIEPVTGAQAGVDFRAYADAVAAELARAGYTPTMTAGTAPGATRFTATIEYRRGGREALERGPAFSLGVGGGSFGRGGGVGGGVGVPIGGAKVRDIVGTELSVKIAERGGAGAGVVWEGRAMTEADARLPDASPEIAARKLADALFRGFPGESGRTITVK